MDKLLNQLQDDKHISEDQARVVRREAALKGYSVRSALLETEFVSVNLLAQYQGDNAQLTLNADDFVPDNHALDLLTEHTARRFSVLPVSLNRQRNHLQLAISDPTNVLVRDSIRREIDLNIGIEYQRANEKQISQALDKCFGSCNSLQTILRELDEQTDNLSKMP